MDIDSDNGIIEQKSEIHTIEQIQNAESESVDSNDQSFEGKNVISFIEKINLEGKNSDIISPKNFYSFEL